jgi:hypothetical protein
MVFRVAGGFLKLFTCAERVLVLSYWFHERKQRTLIFNIKTNKLVRLSLSLSTCYEKGFLFQMLGR